jgi:hypothetical protein
MFVVLVFKSLALAVDAQINHVHKSIGKDTIKLLVDVPKCFIPVLCKISSFEIQQCLIQSNHLSSRNQTKTCSPTLLRGVGIPCSHWLADILGIGNCLIPDYFHLQWHLKYNPESTVLLSSFYLFFQSRYRFYTFHAEQRENDNDPKVDVDEEIQKIVFSLCNEEPSTILDFLIQFKQIVAGTHKAIPIQASEVKQRTKC